MSQNDSYLANINPALNDEMRYLAPQKLSQKYNNNPGYIQPPHARDRMVIAATKNAAAALQSASRNRGGEYYE